MQCKRCGTCCLADMIGEAEESDLARWEREGRDDILQAFRDMVWGGDHFISIRTGLTIHSCPFLAFEEGHFACTIYETRPRVCRAFEPASSQICPCFGEP